MMNAVTDNAELVVFGASFIPTLLLIFRYFLKLQTSGDTLYQGRLLVQSKIIDDMAEQITELRAADDECRNQRSILQRKVDELEEKIFQMELKLGT